MKYILHIFSLSLFTILFSCSNNDEPEHRVFMQPASIASSDANGWNQSFDYDEYGRIVSWTETSNSTNETTCSAHFDYSDENTINVTSVDDFLRFILLKIHGTSAKAYRGSHIRNIPQILSSSLSLERIQTLTHSRR